MIAFAVWERNILFGLFVVIAEILLIAWGNREPEIISFLLTETELEIGALKIHSLKEFESWSADDVGGGWTEFFFNFKTHVKIPLKVLVPDERVEEIRRNLKTVLKEVEHQPSLIDAIERLIGF